MNLENYTIQATVLDIVRTRKNLTATALNGLNLHNMKRGHEYWRLDTIMLDGKLTKFMEQLNDPETNTDTKQNMLRKHCTHVDRIIDWLADTGIPEKLDWRQRGTDAWSMRVDDMEIQLMRMGNGDYVVTQTLFLDQDSFYKQHITRLCTDAPLDEVKKKALDIVAEHMKNMASELETKANVVQSMMNKNKPTPGTIFSTERMPENHYEKLIQCRAMRNEIHADGYAESQEHAAARLMELKDHLGKDMKPFMLLIIEHSTFRQYDMTRQATFIRSLSDQYLSNVVDLAVKFDGYEYELYADRKNKTIMSSYTDYRVTNCTIEYRIVKNNDPIITANLNDMLTNGYHNESQMQSYLDEHTESLYERFEHCLKGTDLWMN